MSSEARVMQIPVQQQQGKRRGRRGADGKDKKTGLVLFCLGEREQKGQPLILNQEFESEGAAMVEALKRDVPYYRVEVWRPRPIVREGAVEIKKEPVTAEI
jgi:hypothetical protein